MAAHSFITDEILAGRLSDLFRRANLNAPTTWGSIIADSNAAAANEIDGALASRDFTAVQRAAWNRGAEFQTDIGLWWCLIKGGVAADFAKDFIDELDRRLELLTVFVETDDDEEDDESTGRVASGTLSTVGDIFKITDPI